jgi:glutathione peroxidase
MTIYEHELNGLDGEPLDLRDYQDKALLIVNVASKCGLTPQYAGLEKIQEQYGPKGFSVLGVPCNQFMGQEPGTSEEIATFCSTTYGVTFPLAEKVEVNGEGQHPLYADLTAVADSDGKAGDVAWNFEKFLVAPGGAVTRFRPQVEPEDPALIGAIEAALPA